MANDISFPRLKKYLLRACLYALLGILPLTILVSGLEREFENEFQRNQEDEAGKRDASMVPLHDPLILHSGIFDYGLDFFSRFLGAPDPIEYAAAELKQLKTSFPGCFEFVLFDRNNQVVASLSDLKEFHGLLNRFGPEYMACQASGSPVVNEHLNRYRPFLGHYFGAFTGPGLLGERPWYHDVVSSSRIRSFSFIPPSKPGKPWFMVYVTYPLEAREFVFRLLLKYRIYMPELSDLIDLNDPPESWGKGCGEAAPFIPRALEQLGDAEGKTVSVNGFFWSQMVVSPRKRLIMAYPNHSAREFKKAQFGLRAGGFVCFLLLLCLPLLSKTLDPDSLSLKTKLLFLFFYTTAVPLTLLFLSARGLFFERRQMLEKKVFQEQESAVKEFNRGYTDFLSWLEGIALKRKGKPFPGAANDDEVVVKRVSSLVEILRPDFCEIFTENGSSIFHLAKAFEGIFPKLLPFISMQVAKAFSIYNKTETSLKDAAKEQAIGATIESMGVDADEVGANFSESHDTLSEITLGADEMGIMTLAFLDIQKRLKYCAIFSWGGHLGNEYIFKRLPAFQKKLSNLVLGTYSTQQDIWVSAGFPAFEKVPGISATVDLQASPVRVRYEKGDQTFLISGMRGRELKRTFFACSSDEPVRRELAETAVRLWVVGFVLMFLGVGVGYLISENFLRPVKLLSDGMESMKNRDFSIRVPVLSGDEFGRLSDTFNRLMESMGDLEVARVVQETFFPQEPLASDGWEVYGTCVSASRVGGDYYDYFPLKDGRWLILIGDVAGHGVPAALVVAMAKALVSHPTNPTEPSKILDILSLHIFQTLGGRRLMSCFLGLFDPKTALLTACNAGHNYPFLVSAGGVEEIKIRNSLLGTRLRKPYQEDSLKVGDQETMCFYTDGLIEALDADGRQIGYEALGKELPKLIGTNARQTEGAIREWYHRIAAPGPQADDITVVVLQRAIGPVES